MICTIAKFIIEICVLNVIYWVICGILIGINPSAGIRMSKIHIGKNTYTLFYLTQMTKFTFVLSVIIYISLSKIGLSFDLATSVFILHFYIYNRFEAYMYLKIYYQVFMIDVYTDLDEFLKKIGYKQ